MFMYFIVSLLIQWNGMEFSAKHDFSNRIMQAVDIQKGLTTVQASLLRTNNSIKMRFTQVKCSPQGRFCRSGGTVIILKASAYKVFHLS